MSVKEKVLKILEENKGIYISGNELAKQIEVSRNSIWKAIHQLGKMGYEIQAGKNRGYCLSDTNHILSRQSIEKHLKCNTFSIEVLESVSSTNTILKEKAESDSPEWTVIVANEQTQGRGRMGRLFYSPGETGVYMSVLLRPKMSLAQSVTITTAAAVAVAKALEKNTGKDVGIKWVNDIFVDDKKVAGILTEATTDLEDGLIRYVVVGIGINVFSPNHGFPEEIKDVAAGVFFNHEQGVDFRSKIIADILKNLLFLYDGRIYGESFFEEYRKRSILIGREVDIIKKNQMESGKVIGLGSDFSLIVQKSNGETQHLSSGEVSIRPIKKR